MDTQLKATLTNNIDAQRRSTCHAANMAVFVTATGHITFVAPNLYGGHINPYDYGVGVHIGLSSDTNDKLVAAFARALTGWTNI